MYSSRCHRSTTRRSTSPPWCRPLAAPSVAVSPPAAGQRTGNVDVGLDPAWLSDGEFVMRAKAVKKYGLPKMHAMNAMRLADGGEAKYKGGLGRLPTCPWDAPRGKACGCGPTARKGETVRVARTAPTSGGGGAHRWVIPMSAEVKSKFQQDFSEWKNRNDQQAGMARDAYSGFTGGLREFGGLSGMAGAVKDFREAQSAVANASSPAERKAAQARVKRTRGSTNPQGWLAGKVEKIRKSGRC